MNAWLEAFHFLRPHWLWALLALPALWGAWRLRQQRGNVWKDVVDPHLLPHLLERGASTAVRGGAWLGALGFVIAVLALAGPSWRQGEQPLAQSHSPLVIAVDLSTAIAASDLPPSRLLQVRAKLATLLRERQGGQVALVAYAGEAFTVAPLTDDAANVALFLDAMEPDVMPVDGQRADQAIATSVRLMQQAGFDHGQVLLLSDHADAAALSAAAEARRQGYKVSALGVGTPAGAPYRDAQGAIMQARLDAGSLQALVSAGGGGYQTLSAGQADLQALGVLDPAQADASVERGQKGLAWQDEGYWLLPLLMLLALLAFRRGSAFAVVLVCLSLPLAMPVQAQTGAHAQKDSGWWQRADQQAHTRIEQGAEAYRKGDFAAAEHAFGGIDSADAWYNQGNALAKQGRYDEAIAAYDQALKRQPAMEDAIENRKVVDAARKRKPPQGDQQQKQDQKDPQDQGKQDQKQANDQDQQKPDQQDQDKQDPQQSKGQDAPKPGPGKPPSGTEGKPQDGQPSPSQSPEKSQAEQAKAQQAADAAQRQRMQQAMAKEAAQSKQQAEQQAAASAETAEQREQRQAVEAWLRRVPDDPGGLLKNKFRLEYERRQREGK